ncbi:MFS transporter [Mycolicibacterium hodleri]|uniref:DHA2 family efflux MFS transporter permease subunit n=1 Tax=Mycolicibacterium hodleri TaxID=49897 RepID=A0A502EI12_9MYCO|nr:MFS transporter [Mycolicibacterium hodleri]TPG36136.1 DHA2 family efflux MFS transporter permease subunit [Mycolicibacterium hodleri]
MTVVRQLLRPRSGDPWNALWALLVGFFMILLDATIVAVANPSIMDALDVDYDAVIWVTSAYLLAYAVPLLLAGRLGDRFGPRNMYLVGLAVFTAASLWCGLAGSIETLVAARAVQGIGAALLTPQTLSTITRIFPAARRGVALSVWGATAGVATLVGPLAGGVLVDGLGWQWIFIVNVPIGVVGLVLAYVFVPVLPTEKHGFDVLGVALSGVGMLMIVFALQEGQSHDWRPWIWALLLTGVAAMAGFVYWQAVNPHEPLIPLKIFRDNDFSMSNVGIAVIGFAVTAMIVPVMFYAQAVCGLSPTRSALLTAPMAVSTGVLAPFVGKLVDRAHPRPIVGFGFSALAIALTWLSIEMTPTTPIWRLLLPFILMGIGMAFIWSPLAATATRNLPAQLAGAGSGVYNTTRQVGGVLGSAGMAALMTSQISSTLPPALDPGVGQGAVTRLPSFLHAPFATALSQSLLLPAFVALFGVIAALFLKGTAGGSVAAPRRAIAARTDVEPDYFPDDDDYFEYTVDWSSRGEEVERVAEWNEPARALPRTFDVAVHDVTAADDSATAPIVAHVEHPLPAPSDTWRGGRVETWHSLMDDGPVAPTAEPEPEPEPEPIAQRNGHAPWRSMLDQLLDDTPRATASDREPIGLAHNGFHVEAEQDLRVPPAPSPRRGRHSRVEDRRDEDPGTYGRHSMHVRD